MFRKGPFPATPSPSETETVTGTVTWFSPSKGFGFIKPADNTDDIFVHVSVVQRFGRDSLREGATVTCEVAPGKKGRQVVTLIEVDDATATAADAGARPARGPAGSAPGPVGEPGAGAIKWFNATKGFGFITPDAGGKDVFLHASVVRRAGLSEVQTGQRCRYTAVEREKGPEARSLEITDDVDPDSA